MTPSIAIVIPALDEAPNLAGLLPDLAARRPSAEVVVADGGSGDATAAVLRGHPSVRLLVGPRGRARQMNAGATFDDSDALLFLHADTRLPDGAIDAIVAALANGRHRWGRFDVTIEGRSRWLPVVAAMMNMRSRLSGIATGDQAIFVRRDAFEEVGGFPDWPLMEDIGISRALKRLSRPAALRLRVITAGRRWDANGPLRTIAAMWWLRLRFYFGARPERLAASYQSVR